jgi:hypothetical protein
MGGAARGQGQNPLVSHPRFTKEEHKQAIADLHNLFLITHHRKIQDIVSAVSTELRTDGRGLLSRWSHLVSYYSRAVISILMLLNSRNLAEEQSLTPHEINRVLPKGHSQVRLGHRKVSIHLSKVQRNRGQVYGGDSEDMPLHSVRGHWKVRRTGVFFWRPFDRGNPIRGYVEKEYKVKP